jgi:hypothetical protein
MVITGCLDKELHQLLFTCGLEDISHPNLMEKKQCMASLLPRIFHDLSAFPTVYQLSVFYLLNRI